MQNPQIVENNEKIWKEKQKENSTETLFLLAPDVWDKVSTNPGHAQALDKKFPASAQLHRNFHI